MTDRNPYFGTCTMCEGTGRVSNPEMRDAVEKERVCNACAGSGKEVTKAGNEILDFLFFVKQERDDVRFRW